MTMKPKNVGFSPNWANKLRHQPNEHRQAPNDMWKEGEKSESAHKLLVHWQGEPAVGYKWTDWVWESPVAVQD